MNSVGLDMNTRIMWPSCSEHEGGHVGGPDNKCPNPWVCVGGQEIQANLGGI